MVVDALAGSWCARGAIALAVPTPTRAWAGAACWTGGNGHMWGSQLTFGPSVWHMGAAASRSDPLHVPDRIFNE